ncbi:hypothetical protein BU26DRAFT_109044 [Trematosphaeria pertusa]|uniref:Uncharacterized protein n=1 Tax=Trematosphaeria pertusa TaxID=390896 RepID=A0A6A6I0I1_9PLEO|nr:uncharacterized protein BU26DRAFT_109044 [Trematosphaeria pertusa]KAF2243787.1 hypothetical protein BU26DRAFT_109044 [Trematosphaeria pertusa]
MSLQNLRESIAAAEGKELACRCQASTLAEMARKTHDVRWDYTAVCFWIVAIALVRRTTARSSSDISTAGCHSRKVAEAAVRLLPVPIRRGPPYDKAELRIAMKALGGRPSGAYASGLWWSEVMERRGSVKSAKNPTSVFLSYSVTPGLDLTSTTNLCLSQSAKHRTLGAEEPNRFIREGVGLRASATLRQPDAQTCGLTLFFHRCFPRRTRIPLLIALGVAVIPRRPN